MEPRSTWVAQIRSQMHCRAQTEKHIGHINKLPPSSSDGHSGATTKGLYTITTALEIHDNYVVTTTGFCSGLTLTRPRSIGTCHLCAAGQAIQAFSRHHHHRPSPFVYHERCPLSQSVYATIVHMATTCAEMARLND